MSDCYEAAAQYAIRIPGCGYITDASGAYGATSLHGAGRFNSVGDALASLQSAARKAWTFVGVQIVRVEEVRSAPRREVVTKGDLSLLNKGPVVLYGIYAEAYFNDSRGHAAFEGLVDARTFPNQAAATEYLTSQRRVSKEIGLGAVEIRPIREIPGAVEYKETVLA